MVLGFGAGVVVGLSVWFNGVVVAAGVWLTAGVELADPASGAASGSRPAPQAVQASTTSSDAAVRPTMVTVVTSLS